MVGSEVLAQAIADNEITAITAIVRKPLQVSDPKLSTILHSDFLNYSGLEEVFRNSDGCLWCLGISQNLVDEKQYIVITYDYAIAAAEAMLRANAGIRFLFLSGDGAKTDEKSRILFGRIKGRTENALLKLPFRQLHIARPAAILPVNHTESYPMALKLQYMVVRILKYVMPSYVITSVDLAKALLHIIKKGYRDTIIPYQQIKTLANEINASNRGA
jgi:hypothetical protein